MYHEECSDLNGNPAVAIRVVRGPETESWRTAMDRKPFEIVAECEMPVFPTAADITRASERIETARRGRSDVVRVTVNPPAIYRERRYVLQAKLITWAEDVSRAVQSAQKLLAEAGLSCRTVLPSSRSLIAAEVPPPSEPARSRRLIPRGGATAARRASRTRAGKSRPRAAKGAARRKTR